MTELDTPKFICQLNMTTLFTHGMDMRLHMFMMIRFMDGEVNTLDGI